MLLKQNPVLAIKDDGTLLLRGFTVPIPSYFAATETPGVYNCTLPSCKYRRFSYRIAGGALLVQLHCFVQQKNCTPGECSDCPLATPDTSKRRVIQVETIEEKDGEEVRTIPSKQYIKVADADPRIERGRPNWIVQHEPLEPTEARPDLQGIQDALPAHKPGRDRKFKIEPNGVILYEHDEAFSDPPKDIDGYERDPHNPLRFIPLWPRCDFRHQIGVRYSSCGCLGIVMRCNHPQAAMYMERLKHTDCAACPESKHAV